MQASRQLTAQSSQVTTEEAIPAGRGWLARTGRVSVGYATVVMLLCALATGVWGLGVKTRGIDYHLVVETIAVAAALTGVYAERIAGRVERRHAAVRAVRDELGDNIALLDHDPRFEPQDLRPPEPRIYPRLAVAAADACLAQAALTDDGDAQRTEELAHWREHAQTFNRTLSVIELVCYGVGFTDHDAQKVIAAADQELQEERAKIAKESRRILSLI
jgi:hypothetical protein